LLSIYVDLASRRAHVAPLGRLVIRALQAIGRGCRRSRDDPARARAGTLHANYHVTAVV
jgi:hypothetical protein